MPVIPFASGKSIQFCNFYAHAHARTKQAALTHNVRGKELNRAIRDICVCECMHMMFVHLIFTGYKVAFPSMGRKVTIWVVNQQHKLLHVI